MDLGILWAEFVRTLIKFLYAPIIFPEILWITIPLVSAILLMELYFSRYSRESIGHHKSLENTIFLLFISFDLIRFAVTRDAPLIKIILTIMMIIFFFAVAWLDFFHRLPLSLFHKVSSKLVIAYVSYIMIVLMYSDMLVSLEFYHIISVVLSVILIFGIIVFVRKMIALLEPKSYEEIEHFLSRIENDLKKSAAETGKGSPEKINESSKKKTVKKKNQPK